MTYFFSEIVSEYDSDFAFKMENFPDIKITNKMLDFLF